MVKLHLTLSIGLFTFVLVITRFDSYPVKSIVRFYEFLQHNNKGVSRSAHESLVIPKCAGIQPKDFDSANREHRYIRMYVGLEEPGYLINDLDQALEKVSA